MTQTDKTIIGKRKPVVSNACIGCTACVAISEEVFELPDIISVVKELDDYEWKDVEDAIIACPVRAISWQNI